MKRIVLLLLACLLSLSIGVPGLCEAAQQARPVEPAEGFDRLGGVWRVGGIVSNRWVYDIHDAEGLEDLYDNQYLWFDEGGGFVYAVNVFRHEGVYAPFRDGSYLLRKQSGYRLTSEDNTLVRVALGGEAGSYVAEFVGDDNTLIFGEMDPMTGTIKADDTPLIFVKEGYESSYIADNKKDVGGDMKDALDSFAPAKPVNPPTFGEWNALERAYDYLAVIPFSHDGLIDQLEFEGFGTGEATYAADHCGADWYEQAVRRASQYLEIFSFSRSELIDQLEFDGYTHSEAVYGAERNGY